MQNKPSNTRFKSICYVVPQIYDFMTSLLCDEKSIYGYIVNEIGKNKTILDLGCGTGILLRYMDKSNDYVGWDLNPYFIHYLQKRGIKAYLHDIFDVENYPECDIIFLSEILHHIVPRHELLLSNALKHCDKVIIREPFTTSMTKFSTNFGFFNKILHKIQVPKRLYQIIDYFLTDNDGFSAFDERLKWDFTYDGIISFYKKFGVKKVVKSGNAFIGIFVKRRD